MSKNVFTEMVRHIMIDCLGVLEMATAFKDIFVNSVTFKSLARNKKIVHFRYNMRLSLFTFGLNCRAVENTMKRRARYTNFTVALLKLTRPCSMTSEAIMACFNFIL
jgi:hypothetical protein